MNDAFMNENGSCCSSMTYKFVWLEHANLVTHCASEWKISSFFLKKLQLAMSN